MPIYQRESGDNSNASLATQEHENHGVIRVHRQCLQGGNSYSQETQLTQQSIVTTEPLLNENALSTEEKKRKIQEVYYGRSYREEDKYEVQKVRKIVRENIFKHVKFCIGEGSYGTNKDGRTKSENKNIATKNTFGQSHEYPDITLRKGYAYEILELSGYGVDKKSLSQRALWWKTYNRFVQNEIRQVRSGMNHNVKKSCVEGKKLNL